MKRATLADSEHLSSFVAAATPPYLTGQDILCGRGQAAEESKGE